MMKTLVRIVSCLSAAWSTLLLFQPKNRWTVLLLSPFKFLAGGLSPVLAAAGLVGATLGQRWQDRWAFWSGLFSATAAVRHIVRVAAPHDAFAEAFDPYWPSRIPSGLRGRMLARRYTPLPPPPAGVPWQRDLTLDSDPDTGEPLLADLWQPPADVPQTGLAILYLHGGAWHYSDKDVGTRHFFRHLAGQGHVVVDLAYTLAPKGDLLRMIGDVKRAIAWIKVHAAELGVNSDQVVLMGGSAGGHLALLAAYTPNDPAFQPVGLDADTSVQAVVSYYGPTDLRATYRYAKALEWRFLSGRSSLDRAFVRRLEAFFRRNRLLLADGQFIPIQEILPRLLGGTPEEVPGRYELFSPIHHVGPHCPPTLLLQGEHDLSGMTPDVRRLHRTLRKTGCISVYVEFPETDHAFDLILPRLSPAAQAATYDVERFLGLIACE
jgi:acetyl esterase/lipase